MSSVAGSSSADDDVTTELLAGGGEYPSLGDGVTRKGKLGLEPDSLADSASRQMLENRGLPVSRSERDGRR